MGERHLTTDDLWPRDAEHRYRVYARQGQTLTILAASPTAGGVGVAIETIHEDERAAGRTLGDLGQLGVLDVTPGGELRPVGEWVVQPWSRPEL